VIQRRNLLADGDLFPYGQVAESDAAACWDGAIKKYAFENTIKRIKDFNSSNTVSKKGISLMPICFGISFTKILMNQARALVHVYLDGSVNISTGAVEMGQGVNTKMLQVASTVFSIDPTRVSVNTTNTFRIANTSPSAASATADLNGKAVQLACNAIKARLYELAATQLSCRPEQVSIENEIICIDSIPTSITWNQLVLDAYLSRISLSEHGHYATPDIHFDNRIEKGHPFAYHVYGTAITEVTVDCIRGTYVVDSVQIMHDAGNSMNAIIDRGQIEGGLVQGIGWMTMEEIVYDQQGRLRSNALSTYKVPDIYSAPKNIELEFMRTDRSNLAIFNSKAVGEPPLMYGIGAYFALRNAIKSFNPSKYILCDAPMTPEKVLMSLYNHRYE
jgi:xanthine dehydrogenase large subunit